VVASSLAAGQLSILNTEGADTGGEFDFFDMGHSHSLANGQYVPL
jgi:hypothetical protein